MRQIILSLALFMVAGCSGAVIITGPDSGAGGGSAGTGGGSAGGATAGGGESTGGGGTAGGGTAGGGTAGGGTAGGGTAGGGTGGGFAAYDGGFVVRRDAGLYLADGGTGEGPATSAPVSGFSWQMAGVFVLANDPLTASAQTLKDNHFSYVGQYGMNNCANNSTPYSCAANGCNYPGNPGSSGEIPNWTDLVSWLNTYKSAGLYVGLWGVTTTNVEAEGHCMAEIVNTLKNTYGVTIDLIDVDGEKAYETVQSASQRFVTEFNATLQVPIAKAYTPECHTAVPTGPWLNGGFTSIQPMAYWNDSNTNPAYCLSWLAMPGGAGGVPLANRQVMLDGYKHGMPHVWTEYGTDMQSVGAVGFSIWRSPAAGEWSQFRSIIETKNMAIWSGSTTVTTGAMSVTSSSVFNPFSAASNLIDGDYTSLAHTSSEPTPWVKLDFGTPQLTDSLKLWNRADCCQVRLQSYTIDIDPNDCAFDDSSRVVDMTMMPAGLPSVFNYSPRTTRCMRVQLKTTDFLHPAELEPHRNLARGATVTASSTYNTTTFPLSNLVDGKAETYTHTNQQWGPWLKVDLGRRRTIDRVQLWNRPDCCADRLKNYAIDADPDDCSFDNSVRIADVTNTPVGFPSVWGFEPITARCVRLLVREDMPLHPAELQIYGY